MNGLRFISNINISWLANIGGLIETECFVVDTEI